MSYSLINYTFKYTMVLDTLICDWNINNNLSSLINYGIRLDCVSSVTIWELQFGCNTRVHLQIEHISLNTSIVICPYNLHFQLSIAYRHIQSKNHWKENFQVLIIGRFKKIKRVYNFVIWAWWPWFTFENWQQQQ